MKIKLEKIKQYYLDIIRLRRFSYRFQCPSLEDHYKAHANLASQRLKNKIVDHISQCNFCLDDFNLMREIINQNRILSLDIIKLAKKSNANGSYSYRDSLVLNGRNKLVIQNTILIALPILLVLFINFDLLFNRHSNLNNTVHLHNRSISQNNILLLLPRNGCYYSQSTLIFNWSSSQKTDYYIFELYDEHLYSVWKSEAIFEPMIKPPNNVIQQLTTGKIYFWMVIGKLPEGNFVISKTHYFYYK